MNVFCLDRDPTKAAEMMCDKHVVKMIIETCQILSAVIDVNYIDEHRAKGWKSKPSQQLGCPNYPPAHVKHPATLWAIEARGNAVWLCKHLRELCRQYYLRYDNKSHKLEGCTQIYEAQLQYCKFKQERKTEFVQAITDKRWHRKDPVEAYRTYYNMEKFTFAKWKLGNKPEWFVGAPVYEVVLD